MLSAARHATQGMCRFNRLEMNSEDSLAVLQHVLPALDQGHEPHFHTARSVGDIGIEWLPQVSQGSSIALEKVTS